MFSRGLRHLNVISDFGGDKYSTTRYSALFKMQKTEIHMPGNGRQEPERKKMTSRRRECDLGIGQFRLFSPSSRTALCQRPNYNPSGQWDLKLRRFCEEQKATRALYICQGLNYVMDENGLQFGTVQRSLSEIFLPRQHLLSSNSSEKTRATVLKANKSQFWIPLYFLLFFSSKTS